MIVHTSIRDLFSVLLYIPTVNIMHIPIHIHAWIVQHMNIHPYTLPYSLSASKNINDWWLAYWISHSNKHPGALLNTTTSYSTTLVGSGYDGGNQTALRGASDNLAFFLGIYGGLAAANSVSDTCLCTYTVLMEWLFCLFRCLLSSEHSCMRMEECVLQKCCIRSCCAVFSMHQLLSLMSHQ